MSSKNRSPETETPFWPGPPRIEFCGSDVITSFEPVTNSSARGPPFPLPLSSISPKVRKVRVRGASGLLEYWSKWRKLLSFSHSDFLARLPFTINAPCPHFDTHAPHHQHALSFPIPMMMVWWWRSRFTPLWRTETEQWTPASPKHIHYDPLSL